MRFDPKCRFCALVVLSAMFLGLTVSNGNTQISGVPLRAASPSSPMQVPAGQPVPVSGSTAPTGPDGEPLAAEPEQSPEEILVQSLLAAKFERTTQNVLKAWSFRPPVKKVKKPAAEEVREFAGSIESVVGSVVVISSKEVPIFKPKSKIELRNGELTIAAEVISVEEKKLVVKISAPKKSPASKQVAPQSPESKKVNETKKESGEKKAAVKKENAKENSSTVTKDKSAAKQSASKESDKFAKGAAIKFGLPKVEPTIDHAAIAAEKTKKLVRSVMLGKWSEIKPFLSDLKPADANKVYAHILTDLAKSVPTMPEGIPAEMAQQLQQLNRRQPPPKSFLTPDDILALTEAAPTPIQIPEKKKDKEGKSKPSKAVAAKPPTATPAPPISVPPGVAIDQLPPEVRAQLAAQGALPGGSKPEAPNHLPKIGQLIQIARTGGHDFAKFVSKLESGTTHFGKESRIKTLTTAQLLMIGGLTDEVEKFLPKLDDEKTKSDVEALKIWALFTNRRYSEKGVAKWLEKSWNANLWITEIADVEKSDKDRALTNLIELSPKVEKEIGQAWINASFTNEPERGMKILTNLGTKSATMAKQAASISPTTRFKLLTLQNKAVENLIRVSPDKAGEWAQAMTMLANNWLGEAETTITYSKDKSRRSFMQIDMYGNYYWTDQDQYMARYGGQRNPRPIKIGDMLEICPSQEWQKFVSPSLHTQLRKVTASLHLRINEEDKAFPFIEQIAPDHPEIAKDLIQEFLRIWTKNHDPNTDKRQRNPYIYFYGFDQKAEAIPLTRSKQERNLKELRSWVDRIRKMKNVDIDESLLADAFTTCHSSAEVFRLESVKSVFGDLDKLKPETVAAICQKMRDNLGSNWRDVRNQEAKQTKRKEPEVKKEVQRGYKVALELAEEALAGDPENWQLHLAKACLMYDDNAYSQNRSKKF